MPLYPYQVSHARVVAQALVKHRAALDASDTGTGKTYVALALVKELGVTPLVIGPKAAKIAWQRAAKLMGVEVEYTNYEMARPHTKNQDSEWTVLKPYGKGSFVQFKAPPAFVIFDEVHRCSGMKSLNSKLLIAARRQCRHVLALSATSADNPLQMKSLGFALGLHTLNGNTGFYPWLQRHGCRPDWTGRFAFTEDREKQAEAMTKLNSEIFPAHGGRMRKREIPGFPETRIDSILLDPEGKADELDERLRELHDLRESQEMTAAEGLEELIRIRQKLEILKVPSLVELARDFERTSKVAIFVNFQDTLNALVTALRGSFEHVGFVDGSQTGAKGAAERQDFIDRFQRNEIPVLVLNCQAGGESVNLHCLQGEVERTALITPPLSGRQFVQITGRVHRAGGAFSQQFLTLFKGTREERIAGAVLAKAENIHTLNDGDFSILN